MKILQINKSLYEKGGDAIVTLETGKLLHSMGHGVQYWGMDHPNNPHVFCSDHLLSFRDLNKPGGIFNRMRFAMDILYSLEARYKIQRVLESYHPDIVHLHNFAHQISPSILDAIKKYQIPVIMTMHDYKIVCASYLMYQSGKPCQACARKRYYNCLANRCVKGSLVKSVINTIEMYLHHRILHIYDNIDIFISPSMFLKEMLHSMDFKRRIEVIPNFIDTSRLQPQFDNKGYLLYFGRLSKEKGLKTFLFALQNLDVHAHIVGTGPFEQELRDLTDQLGLKNVVFRGYLRGDALYQEITGALCVILPSEWYENNPRSILESFAFGKPVIGADIGGIPELIGGGQYGMLFTPGDQEQLRACIIHCISHPDNIRKMGMDARTYVERNYNPKKYYKSLIEVYMTARNA